VLGTSVFALHAASFTTHPPPPHSTRAIKSTKTPSISLESVLRACGLYELSFTRLDALFLAVLSCFSPDFVSLRPQLRRDRHPTIFRPRGTPLFEATVLPHLLFGCGDDILGGNLGVTSLRDTISSRRCTSATPPFAFGHLWALGSTHPSPPTTSEAV
jgi:hypothetical protein